MRFSASCVAFRNRVDGISNAADLTLAATFSSISSSAPVSSTVNGNVALNLGTHISQSTFNQSILHSPISPLIYLFSLQASRVNQSIFKHLNERASYKTYNMYKSTPTLHMSAPQWVISKLSTSGAGIEEKNTLFNRHW